MLGKSLPWFAEDCTSQNKAVWSLYVPHSIVFGSFGTWSACCFQVTITKLFRLNSSSQPCDPNKSSKVCKIYKTMECKLMQERVECSVIPFLLFSLYCLSFKRPPAAPYLCQPLPSFKFLSLPFLWKLAYAPFIVIFYVCSTPSGQETIPELHLFGFSNIRKMFRHSVSQMFMCNRNTLGSCWTEGCDSLGLVSSESLHSWQTPRWCEEVGPQATFWVKVSHSLLANVWWWYYLLKNWWKI